MFEYGYRWSKQNKISQGSLLRNTYEFPRSNLEKVHFYLRHKKLKNANLDQIFSESKIWTIAHKNQKWITAATHWKNIIGPHSQKFAIGADSFNKDSKYYTKENTPTDVFGALMFMMSASLEHPSVSDEHSSLIDEQLVSIMRSSYPKDNRTPKLIHTNCFGKPNKIFCRFVIEYIAMSLFFDYWGEHSASSGPAPYNDVSTYFILRPHIKLIVSKLNTLNF